MSLTGISPNNQIPADRREIIFGAGPAAGESDDQDVLIYGNKTSAGTETVETLGLPIASEQDMKNRAGKRSEAYWEYWAYRQVDPQARIYFIPVTEAAGGTAGSVTFTIVTTATADTTVDVFWGGFTASYTVRTGDTAIVQAAALVVAINNAEQGTWPFTAAQQAPANDHKVDLTTANIGDRATFALSRVRVIPRDSIGTTYTKGSVTNGSGTDDFTLALALAASAGEFAYQVSPKHATAGVTTTDNGIGEHIMGANGINAMANPTNAKGQQVFFGLVGTQAQATTVATSAGANSTRAKFIHAENNDWTPGMLAAHHAAIQRVAEMVHPAANINGYRPTETTPYMVPPPYDANDRPTLTEQDADLYNGVCPVAFDNRGVPTLVRSVTSRSLDSLGQTDHKAHEGHIPHTIDFSWTTIKKKLAEIRKSSPFVDADLAKNQMPRPKTVYPKTIKDAIASVIDDLTSARPLGRYDGPILSPSKAEYMKSKIVSYKMGVGKIFTSCELIAVEHFISSETAIYETSAAQ